MSKVDEAVRIYSGSDAEMNQASRVMHGFFVADQAVFTAFDSSLAGRFEASWNSSIERASNVVQDTATIGKQTELTSIVESKMEAARQHFKSMKYFIEKAFPNKKEIWTQFGYNDFEKARYSETKMIQFLGLLFNAAITYKEQLTAAGFGEDKINIIKTMQTELTEADYNQEKVKKERSALTQERISILNECYGFMQKVSKAAKIIFADNYAKYNQYLLPSERSVKKEEETPPPPPNPS